MLTCEGYKMFEGTALIANPSGEPLYVTGRWLFRPDIGYWFVNGSPDYPWGTSFPEEDVTPEVDG